MGDSITVSEDRRDNPPVEDHYRDRSSQQKVVMANREAFRTVEKFTDCYGNAIDTGEVLPFKKSPKWSIEGDFDVKVLKIYWDPFGLPGKSSDYYVGLNDDGFEAYECRLKVRVEVVDAPSDYEHLIGNRYTLGGNSFDFYLNE